MRGFQFPPKWDARYPRQGQTTADAPPGYITLFADFFLEGNFRLPATNFIASILYFYGFHISQMSPTGMVRVRNFEFLCRSQGMEPIVEMFRAFYQLIRNIGFYSFGNHGAAKKILISPPKSFHDWKMKFFFIRELPIPKGADWYMNLLATPNRIFGEHVLVTAQMSDKWPERSEEIPVLKFNSEEAQLYQATFPTFGGSMGVRPLQAGEAYWYESIKVHFLYPPAGAFANPPTVTEGARPLRGVTSVGKEILFLSSEESVGSSQEELSSWSNIFAFVLRDLVIDPEERPKKAPAKKKTSKKVIVGTGATSKKGGSSRVTATTHDKGEKKKSSGTASKSSGSAGSRAPESGATPSSIPVEEEEEVEEEAGTLLTRKRSREETAAGAEPTQNTDVAPVIGKQSRLRSLYKFSPEALKKTPEKVKGVELEKPKEPAPKKTKFVIIPPKPIKKEVEKTVEEPTGEVVPEKETLETEAPAITKQDKAQGPKVVGVTGLDQPFKTKGPEVVKPMVAALPDAPTQTYKAAYKDIFVVAAGAGAGGSIAVGQMGEGNKGSMPRAPIGAKDTLGDIYYKTYTEDQRGEALHQPVWGSFPSGEVNRQRARNHEGLYCVYIIGEANARSANHQIVREWRTMHKERADWEKYQERLVKEVQGFEQLRNKFPEEKASFKAEKKAEEWGREGLKNKLQAAKELLSKKRAEWKKACVKDNQRMYAARSKITDFEAEIATLKGKVEEAQADKERAELNACMVNKDKDLAAKDVEIAELKRRLFEAHDKNESLEIDLEAERVKAETAKEAKRTAMEACEISTSALNVAQNNYAEAQTIVDMLVSESEWMRNRRVAAIANSILNANKLDQTVAALTDATRAVGHRGGYLECAQHVEEALGQHFCTRHCSVSDAADSMLSRAEEVYDHLSLRVMELVTDALKHDDWSARLKSILDPPETVELSDKEGAGGDGDGDGDAYE
ncbi:hypothetical protein Hdeb2414_s0005g00162461 [Helianthus debilis subsp. tardiflorus]